MAPNGKRKEESQERKPLQSGIRKRPSDSQNAAEKNQSAAEDAVTIERLLDETSRRLAHTPETPLRRELSLVLERYRRTLRDWPTQPPTPLQREILIDCVKALHHRVASRSFRKLPPL